MLAEDPVWFVEALLSPSILPLEKVAECQRSLCGDTVPRYKGHIITRNWGALPGCAGMRVFGVDSLFSVARIRHHSEFARHSRSGWNVFFAWRDFQTNIWSLPVVAL